MRKVLIGVLEIVVFVGFVFTTVVYSYYQKIDFPKGTTINEKVDISKAVIETIIGNVIQK